MADLNIFPAFIPSLFFRAIYISILVGYLSTVSGSTLNDDLAEIESILNDMTNYNFDYLKTSDATNVEVESFENELQFLDKLKQLEISVDILRDRINSFEINRPRTIPPEVIFRTSQKYENLFLGINDKYNDVLKKINVHQNTWDNNPRLTDIIKRISETQNVLIKTGKVLKQRFEDVEIDREQFRNIKLKLCVAALKDGNVELAKEIWDQLIEGQNGWYDKDLTEIIETIIRNNNQKLFIRLGRFISILPFHSQRVFGFSVIVNSMNSETDSNYSKNIAMIGHILNLYRKPRTYASLDQTTKDLLATLQSKIKEVQVNSTSNPKESNIALCIEAIKSGSIQLAYDVWEEIKISDGNGLYYSDIIHVIKSAYENGDSFNSVFAFVAELTGFNDGSLSLEVLANLIDRNDPRFSNNWSKIVNHAKVMIESPDYRQIEIKYKNIILKLRYSLPNVVCLRNVNLNEYLYSSDFKSGYDLNNRNVFTGTGDVRQQFWRFISTEDGFHFYIQNTASQVYLKASDDLYNSKRRLIFTFTSVNLNSLSEAFEWSVRPVGEFEIELVNVFFNQTLYASKIRYGDKRLIFARNNNRETPMNSKWKIENCD